MRGGALVLAAQMLSCLLVPVVSPAQTVLVRTRDVGFATIRFENGLTLGATTVYEGLEAKREKTTTSANGVMSLFHDGRWSVQGFLDGSRLSDPMPGPAGLGSLFRSVRGEAALGAATSAQSGLMPTLEVQARTRVHFDHVARSTSLGAAIARTFDGRFWRTTVLGEASGWARTGTTLFTLQSTPMQLGIGDFLVDNEASAEWRRGTATVGFSLGLRVGEAQRGTVGWGGTTLTWQARDDLWMSVSLGSYPADLLQSLPGGRYAAVTFRLPNGRVPPLRRRPALPPAPPQPDPLPVTERLAMVIGLPLDSLHLREVRVWAPGVRTVELLADFVDWIPVPLIRQTNGEWRGYYRVSPGLHRVNLLLDGQELDVPVNLHRQVDEFGTAVGLILVR